MPGIQPFPDLEFYPTSGLPFAWAEYQGSRGGSEGTGDANLGPEGCGAGMEMLIFWNDLLTALQSLLGYSYRVQISEITAGGGGGGFPIGSTIGRNIPWQHPIFNQLFVKSIPRVRGLQMNGMVVFDTIKPGAGSPGTGFTPNLGPITSFTYALLTIQFWRPTYYIKTDDDIAVYSAFFGGKSGEWLRYVDREWTIEPQMLTRSGGSVVWGVPSLPGGGGLQNTTYYGAPQGQAGQSINAPIGTKIAHLKLSRVWHEIPAACLFSIDIDGSPSGVPYNLLYSQSTITNPVTGFIYSSGSPINGCVNATIGGDIIREADPDFRLFGVPCGTLLYEGAEIVERPLQLPSVLMEIGIIPGNWPLAQTQYDVKFHFDYFDPPFGPTDIILGQRPGGITLNSFIVSGHNLAPYPGDNLWYPVTGQLGAGGVPLSNTAPARTLFDYCDLTDLFSTI